MLLEKISEPFDSEQHQFEMKWDGFRSLVYVERRRTRIVSRWGTDFTPSFPELGNLWPMFGKATVLDGELVVLDDRGMPQFHALQKRYFGRNTDIPITFVAFDVLHYGRSLVDRRLERRAAALEGLVSTTDPLVRRSVPIIGEGCALYDRLCNLNVEGMVAKLRSSRYEERRSRNWLKVYTPHGRSVLKQRLENIPRRKAR